MGLPAIREAKAEGLPITVETCPHYLTIIAEEIPDGAVEFKCCPPIREAANRDLLWEGICDGTIDAIVSDHSPSTVELKRLGDGDFGLGWGGISGLQLGLSAVWTEANQRGIPLSTVLPLYTTGPALVAGFDKVPGLDSVGKITEGALAHLTIFAPNEQLTVDARRLLHRNPISAYDGRTFAGHVRHTWLAGRTVFDVSWVVLAKHHSSGNLRLASFSLPCRQGRGLPHCQQPSRRNDRKPEPSHCRKLGPSHCQQPTKKRGGSREL